ncbi:patatin-like phospholipase family protein [Pantoea ananatis]|uniref:patatin-like phospholipase family protein n=1 Tax=Pantoea ananas TaxID=553 RepID=UPI003FA45A2B
MKEINEITVLEVVKIEKDQSFNFVIEQPSIRNLVFEGGGAKGIAYVGALETLSKNGILDKVNSVAGSSAGAIQALIYGLGYDIEAMKNILIQTNMNQFKDAHPDQNNMNWLQIKWCQLMNAITKGNELGRGFHNGNAMGDWLKKLVHDRVFQLYEGCTDNETKIFLKALQDKEGSITFSEAEEIRKRIPQANFKNMFFTGTNYTKKRLEIFSFETTPNMPLYLAARISGTFPWFFKTVLYNNDEYMDGGALNNFPMQIFDHPDIPKCFIGKDGANLQTLGIRVDSNEEILDILWKTTNPDNRSFLVKYSENFIGLLVGVDYGKAAKGSDFAAYDKYPHRTIQIPDLGYSTLKFDLSDEDKKNLIDAGKTSTQSYLLNYFGEPTCLYINVRNLDELKEYFSL